MGDVTETSLQMVYSAADCRIWPTLDMLIDQSRVWSRVADIAFDAARKELGVKGGTKTSIGMTIAAIGACNPCGRSAGTIQTIDINEHQSVIFIQCCLPYPYLWVVMYHVLLPSRELQPGRMGTY